MEIFLIIFLILIFFLVVFALCLWAYAINSNHKKTVLRRYITERRTVRGSTEYKATAVIGIKLFWGLLTIPKKYHFWCAHPRLYSEFSEFYSEILPEDDGRSVGYYWFEDLDNLYRKFDRELDWFIKKNNFRQEVITWEV